MKEERREKAEGQLVSRRPAMKRPRSKYIHFQDVSELVKKYSGRTKKTRDIAVVNHTKNETIGYVNYYPPFRKYAFTSNGSIVLDNNCLLDIADFVDQMNKEK